jgi:NAD kinase
MSALAIRKIGRRSPAATTQGKARFEKVVIVTRRTELEELVQRFNTVAQARFYLEHAGQAFDPIEAGHARYHEVLDGIRTAIPRGLKQQVVERDQLGQFRFEPADLVVTVGPDGLVVNTAKYLDTQPIVAVNPDPATIDGILLPVTQARFLPVLQGTLQGEARLQAVTMAEARLSDGQRLLAFNDLFIGPRSHVSARYRIRQGPRSEQQSSSGLIVSTGAGSTGWLQSVYAGAAGVITALGGQVTPPPQGGRIPWDAEYLAYAVREPFPSKQTGTSLVFGTITRDQPLILDSQMAQHGVIFSDGIEQDYMQFNAGASATITLAERKAHLVM